MNLGFWYWRHLKYWKIFRLKHYFKYDQDGNPRPTITIADLEDALVRFEIAKKLLDNIPDLPEIPVKDLLDS